MSDKPLKIQKQVVVVGGGVVGICTAYFLAADGHEVALIERRASGAEEASFGNAGIVAPGCALPWARPGTRRQLLASLFAAPARLRPRASRSLWRWLQQWLSECDAKRYLVNRERMQRLAFYSRHLLHELTERHQLAYERTRGVLRLWRSARELAQSAPLFEALAEQGISQRLLDADAARAIEPALSRQTALAGALHLPEDEAGNCALFAKQLRQVAQAAGVQFHFGAEVEAVQPDGARIGLRIGQQTVHADAVVVAAGADSARLLRPLGIEVPLHPVAGYSITLPIRDFEAAPLAAVADDACQATITRLDSRIRIAGLSELGAASQRRHAEDARRALRLLSQVGRDWFPGAAGYQAATPWRGVRPMLPDGPPLLGATGIKNLFLNLGHGAHGFTMAAGSARIVADVIARRAPDIDLDGLTLARYG